MTEAVPIEAVRPTTLYLDAGELAAVIATFDFEEVNYRPPRAFRLDGDLYLAEGHARAFVTHLAGAEELRVDTDSDLGANELRLYRERIDWCRQAGVERIADLAGRVLSTEDYVERWVERCLRTAREITAERD